jgi:hypothetical protein
VVSKLDCCWASQDEWNDSNSERFCSANVEDDTRSGQFRVLYAWVNLAHCLEASAFYFCQPSNGVRKIEARDESASAVQRSRIQKAATGSRMVSIRFNDNIVRIRCIKKIAP